MRFLKRPPIDVEPEQIFEECLAGYTGRSKEEKAANEEKRQKLLTCKDLIKADSTDYNNRILSGSFVPSSLPEGISKTYLSQVYSDTFSKEDKPGRIYYDIIRGQAPCARCPICGSKGGNTHLDHYLPKSEFPTLSVTPDNLIPICSACNEKKGTYHSLDRKTRPFHLYFDRLKSGNGADDKNNPVVFLKAVIAKDYKIIFQVDHPSDRDAELRSRIDKHLEIYGLLKRYEACVEPEIAQLWCDWQDKITDTLEDIPKSIHTQQVEAELLHDLVLEGIRRWRRTPNTWESALYRAMDTQKDMLYDWFKDNANEIKKAVQKYCAVDPDDE